MHCKDCGREIHQTLEKAIGEPADRAWQAVWMSSETSSWVCEVTGDEHVPGEPPLTYEERARFSEGQCHALALAIGDLLTERGDEVEYIAAWLDLRGEEALEDAGPDPYERGPAPDTVLTQHILVLRGDDVFDVAGRTPLKTMDAYVFDGMIGFTSVDMPLVRYTIVSREWVESLAQAWREPDLDAARKAAPLLVALENREYA